jgi:hypothetical protein
VRATWIRPLHFPHPQLFFTSLPCPRLLITLRYGHSFKPSSVYVPLLSYHFVVVNDYPGQSITQVILVCVSGYILARRGILDKATQKVLLHLCLNPTRLFSYLPQQLNVINVNFFTPCLLFSKVAFFLSPGWSLSASSQPI